MDQQIWQLGQSRPENTNPIYESVSETDSYLTSILSK